MNIRNMQQKDISQISELSISTFSNYDIMKKLGYEYLNNIFFPSILNSCLAKGMVICEKNIILGYCIYFLDFRNFYQQLKKHAYWQNMFIILSSLINSNFSFNDILNIGLNHSKVMDKAVIPSHFGPVAISTSIKGSAKGGFAVLSLCRKALKQLNETGINSCWGIADKRNLESQNLLIALGFKYDAEIRLFGRTDYLYTLNF